MLEIVAIYYLCKKNSENAKLRGKKGGGAIAYTICLWIGFEIIGAFIGGFIGIMMGSDTEVMLVYVFALIFAGIGALISSLISKAGPISAQQYPVVYSQQPQPYINYESQSINPYQCLRCGSINPSDSLFCMRCGNPLAVEHTLQQGDVETKEQ